jgi:transposase
MWARIEPKLPAAKGLMGPPFRPHRPVVEGILYRYRTGIPWRDLPKEFGSWQTVHRRHSAWSKDGTWDAVLTGLLSEADAAGELEWAASVDSTVARVHQHGASAARSSAKPFSHTGGASE